MVKSLETINRSFRNQLLTTISADDYSFIAPHLELADLPVGHDVETRGERVEHMYFLESGIVSLVAANGSGKQIEIGLIGREGITGLAVILGDDVANHLAYMQVEGHGYKVPAVVILDALRRSNGLRNQLARFAHTLMIQTAHTALANGRASLVERLSRWILMAHDRVDGNVVPITHEFLALMLGVRRAGVTVALHELEGRRVIKAVRGQITVIDRSGIEKLSNGFYGQPESEYFRLVATQLTRRVPA
ncbi:Crp/Fnr family transcriptional regulator [Taklimakanibacter deserti]|uniref:Crp/Fnr family transcriptional regulator n=1 Tax=Taklimakanibacter deserti TaxID=2267839 RepID=UPI000E6484CB